MKLQLTAGEIDRLFGLLDGELRAAGVTAELHVVGGAVMCLVLGARDSTPNVDTLVQPTKQVREAATRVAAQADVPDDWLNDAVKGFLAAEGDFRVYLELPNLRVFTAEPHYLLAMKCAAMRLGAEFHDLEDVRYVLRHLDIRTSEEALEVVTRYFDEEQLPAKTRLALEELLGE